MSKKYDKCSECLPPAGLSPRHSVRVADGIKHYVESDFYDRLYEAHCRQKTRSRQMKGGEIFPYGIERTQELKELLSPELQKSRFKAFQEKFSEELYCKKPELGKASAFVKSKPPHVTNESFTFGKVFDNSVKENLYDLVMPRKSPDEVNTDYVQGHQLYLLSHNHYFPGEQICRKYKPPFKQASTFGQAINVDYSGVNVLRALKHCREQKFLSKTIANYCKAAGIFGKKFSRFPLDLPEEFTFGQQKRNKDCDIKTLIENAELCDKADHVGPAIGYLNTLRYHLFKHPHFFSIDFENALQRADVDKSGYLPLSHIFNMARKMNIHLDELKLRIVLVHYGLISSVNADADTMMRYMDFADLLKHRVPLPDGITPRTQCKAVKDTVYRLMCKDLEEHQEKHTLYTDGYHDNRVKKTALYSAKDLIMPDIPSQYGLLNTDFEEKRSKIELENIFHTLLSSDEFDQIWTSVNEQLKPSNGLLTVEDIRKEFGMKRDEIEHLRKKL